MTRLCDLALSRMNAHFPVFSPPVFRKLLQIARDGKSPVSRPQLTIRSPLLGKDEAKADSPERTALPGSPEGAGVDATLDRIGKSVRHP
jgi:hypothetical protein